MSRSVVWRDKYAYVKPYALSAKGFVLHELDPNPQGSYFPPPCGATDVLLVRRANIVAENARPCGQCARRLKARQAAADVAARDPGGAA